MSAASNQDMGTGSVRRHMVRLAVPALVGQLINLLYNIVDRIYIGHIPEVGGTALTGVGLFGPILMMITAFAMLAGAGGAPRAAIAMGRGEKDTAEKSFTITGSGHGHNVGMSQWGAFAMAQRGYTYRDILEFYYTGIQLRGMEENV